MPIIFRWLFYGCLRRAAGVMAALLAIYVIIETFDKARYLGRGMTAELIVEYLLLKMPFVVSEFMPVIVLIAVSVYVSELSRHHEVVALRASGLGVNKLLLPLTAVGLVAAATSFGFGEWVTPVTNQRIDAIERVHIHHREEPKHGVQWLREGTRMFRLTPLEEGHFSLVMLETDAEGRWKRRIDAARARHEAGAWHLFDVRVSRPDPREGLKTERRESLVLPSAVGPETADPPLPRHMRLAQLAAYAAELERAGLSNATFRFALQRKLAAPVACLVMILLAAALCTSMGGRLAPTSLQLVTALVVGLAFYIFDHAADLLASEERLPAVFAAWLPVLVFGGLGGYLLLRREGY